MDSIIFLGLYGVAPAKSGKRTLS